MSVYHTSFSYLGKNSKECGWIITHFSDNADTGETDTFLSTSAIYSESYDGTRRQIHGVKYDSVVEAQITVIKQDGTDFGVQDNREALRWLTGSRQATWMDLYMDDEVKYRLLGRVSNVAQYKQDARVRGLIITFESVSPYGYSSLQSKTLEVNGRLDTVITCDSDDLYTYVPMNVQFINKVSGGAFEFFNAFYDDKRTSGESSKISGGLGYGEAVTLSENMMISSDNTAKKFGNTFNYIFPRLAAGTNNVTIEGTGTFTYEYIAPVKLGNIAIDLNSVSDPICNPEGEIILDTLDWSRVVNTPVTLEDYGITNAYTKTEVDLLIGKSNMDNFYTKSEIDLLLQNIDIDNVYTKSEIDEILSNFVSEDVYTKAEIDAKFENIDLSGVDTYTKTEIDEKISNITSSGVDIDEDALNAMLTEVLGE